LSFEIIFLKYPDENVNGIRCINRYMKKNLLNGPLYNYHGIFHWMQGNHLKLSGVD
jgi:hypothetical protein